MSTRRASAPGVSLFPFLAVLMCAMGALILLLLVMTRRIREQAELRALHEQQAAQLAAAEPLPPPPVLALPAPPPARPKPRQIIIRRAPAPPEPPPIVTDPTYEQRRAAQLAAHEQAQRELDRRQQAEVDQLTAEQRRLQAESAALEERLRTEQTRLDQLQQQLRESPSTTTAVDDGAADPTAELRQLAAQRAAFREQIDAVARQLQAAQARRASAPASQYTIVPFDALSGTNRRPIVIECRADALVFAGEGITLTPQDLNGFIPHYNPLSAGVKALYDGWSQRDGGTPPYVLLIVRPQGTIAFYVARTLLQPLDIPFGYELVGDAQQFTWTPTDDALVRECQRAIDETLQERPRVAQLAQSSGRFEPPLQVVGSGGGFRLDEVDRLRQPGRTVQFGQQQVDREQFTAGGGGATEAAERRGLGLFRKPAAGGSQTAEAAAANSPSGQSPPTAPASRGPTPPAPLPEPTTTAGRSSSRDPRAWRPSLGSGVSIVRELPVEITRESLRVCGGDPLAISSQTTTDDLARHIAGVLEQEFATWGPPPKGFAWKPRIKFIVTAEGAPISRNLTPIIEGWGFDSTLDFASRLNRR